MNIKIPSVKQAIECLVEENIARDEYFEAVLNVEKLEFSALRVYYRYEKDYCAAVSVMTIVVASIIEKMFDLEVI